MPTMQHHFVDMTSIDNRGLQTCENGQCYDFNSEQSSNDVDYKLKKHKNDLQALCALEQRRYNCKRTRRAESATA